jgi:hypothetical protein
VTRDDIFAVTRHKFVTFVLESTSKTRKMSRGKQRIAMSDTFLITHV